MSVKKQVRFVPHHVVTPLGKKKEIHDLLHMTRPISLSYDILRVGGYH